VAAAILQASWVFAEDSRIQKAREIRDQLLARKAEAGKLSRDGLSRPAAPVEDAAVEAARARLAGLDASLQGSLQRSEALAEPRSKLVARDEELTAELGRLDEANRRTVDALARRAKIGAGAAGWQSDPGQGARLARYLAAIAKEQQERRSRVEVEHGSVLAALDRARSEDAALAAERRVLEADRAEAQAALDRALEVSSGGRPGSAEEGLSDEGEEEEAGSEAERAMAEAAARMAAASAAGGTLPRGFPGPAAESPAEALAKDAPARSDEFRWPGTQPPPSSAAEAPAVATAGPAANAAEGVSAAPSAEPPSSSAVGGPAESAASVTPSPTGEPEDGTPPELEDGPAVLAPSEDSDDLPPADGAKVTKPPGLLRNLFGDAESDRFASARGSLPVPVPGKVVANYGQQHKSGATYRGVILRAGPGAPVRAVGEGRV
jgi:murein DD-endopeptidase MepM/ murein hydrolase activator NlpD